MHGLPCLSWTSVARIQHKGTMVGSVVSWQSFRLPNEPVSGGDDHAYVLFQPLPPKHELLAAARDRSPQLDRPLARFSEANRLPREVVDAPCLSAFKRCLDNTLKNLL